MSKIYGDYFFRREKINCRTVPFKEAAGMDGFNGLFLTFRGIALWFIMILILYSTQTQTQDAVLIALSSRSRARIACLYILYPFSDHD